MNGVAEPARMGWTNLFDRFPALARIAKSRAFQFSIILPNLVLFAVFLFAGIFGTPVGNKNIIIIFVWILWWVVLIGVLVPFASRLWCGMCPIPFMGEWLQRRKWMGVGSKLFGKGWPWPKKLSNIWMQNIGFLCLASFSAMLVTRPIFSAVVLGGLIIIAMILSALFLRRAFCLYVCPVGGFLGLYSMTSTLALRRKDVEVCNRVKPGFDFTFSDGIAPCRAACPAGVDASTYIALIAEGKMARALEVIRQSMPLAAVCGRVCNHPCETECLRGTVDKPIAICHLKQFVADEGLNDIGNIPIPPRRHTQKIAIIGSGPAGLTCAYYLGLEGYPVTVFESLPVLGGMLRVGIPNFKLDKKILEKEIEFIARSGVEFRPNTTIGKDVSFDEIVSSYDAVFVATGVLRARKLQIEGSELPGIVSALDFLKEVNMGQWNEQLRKVVVVGGGGTAVDAARSAVRLGAQEVTIACLEPRSAMLAPADEIRMAVEEGIKILPQAGIQRIFLNGHAPEKDLLLAPCTRIFDEKGKFSPAFDTTITQSIQADNIIVAIGQDADLSFLKGFASQSLLPVNSNQQTNLAHVFGGGDVTRGPNVFGGGDVTRGADVFVNAVADGHRAAIAIDRYLRGENVSGDTISLHPTEKVVEGVPNSMIHLEERAEPDVIPARGREKSFAEVEKTFSQKKAQEEANRCLSCGICGACYRGTERGWGCPWLQKMGGLARNNYCALCMECVKNCPYDNIGLYARPFSEERKLTGFDEAWKAFIMLTLAGSYSVVLLGPFGAIKGFANVTETLNVFGFLRYTASVWFLCLLGIPLIHGIVSWFARLLSGERTASLKKVFLGFAAPLVPFGLVIWIAFSVPLLMINGAYIVSVISDPFGWGWNLFGTAHVPWNPILPEFVPHIQLGLILLGFLIAFQSAHRNAAEIFSTRRAQILALIPVVVFLTAIALFFGRLYAG